MLNLKLLFALVASFLVGSILQAEPADVSVDVGITAVGQTEVVDNRVAGCDRWTISYSSTGFSVLSLIVESAPGSVAAGSWVTFPGTVDSGINPNTAITFATTRLTGYVPWLRVRLASATGTGKIRGSIGCSRSLVALQKATQAEAEAGTNNSKYMTPLRVAQEIAELSGPGGGSPPTGSLGACQFYATSTTFGGDSSICFENATALSTPAAPVVTPVGTTGATSYAYKVVACNQIGCTAPSAVTTITNGNDGGLDMTNYNSIATVAQPGTTACIVFVASSGSFYGINLAPVTCGSTALDQGGAVEGESVIPVVNQTTGSVLSNQVILGGLLVGGPGYVNLIDTGAASDAAILTVTGTKDMSDSNYPAAALFNLTLAPTYNSGNYGVGVATQVHIPINTASGISFYSQTADVRYQGAASVYALAGFDNRVAFLPSDTSRSAGQLYVYMSQLSTTGLAEEVAGYYSQMNLSGITTNAYGSYMSFNCGGSCSNVYSFYSQDLAGAATNPYYSWFDSNGVHRCKEDSTFDSVGQSICALYNPQFTKYTPGAPDYERQIQGQWQGNVAEFGTYAGGMGTPRVSRVLGSEFHIGTASNLSTTTFMGMGLDDALFNGTYTGADLTYCAIIDGTGTPDTFKWGTNGGCNNGATLVAITGANQALSSGVIIKFAATTGHTATDQWSVTATAATEYAKFNPTSTLVGSGSRPLCVMADGTIYPGSFDGDTGMTICP